MSNPEITELTQDSRGYRPDLNMIGTKWKHLGNDHIYTVIDFHWNGEDDTWMYVHTREGSTFRYLRTPANFHGLRENSEPRYANVPR